MKRMISGLLTKSRTKGGRVLTFAGLASACIAAPVLAHHSFAMYDQSKRLVFTGVVVRVAPNADHQQLYFVPLDNARKAIVRNSKKEPIVWMLEMTGSTQAAAEGVTVDAFRPGTIMSVGLFPLRNGSTGGTRGIGGAQENASPIFRCPAKTPPTAGKHCDSVSGSTRFGKGPLPRATTVWTPPAK